MLALASSVSDPIPNRKGSDPQQSDVQNVLVLSGMHRLQFLPDTGYPAGYQISGRIPDLRPDTWLDNYVFNQINV
jgi:hypothetical protein